MGAIRNLNFNPVITTAERARLTVIRASSCMGPDGEETEGKWGRAREVLVSVLMSGLRREWEGGRHPILSLLNNMHYPPPPPPPHHHHHASLKSYAGFKKYKNQ